MLCVVLAQKENLLLLTTLHVWSVVQVGGACLCSHTPCCIILSCSNRLLPADVGRRDVLSVQTRYTEHASEYSMKVLCNYKTALHHIS